MLVADQKKGCATRASSVAMRSTIWLGFGLGLGLVLRFGFGLGFGLGLAGCV